jgi:hypothetical protein
MGRIGLSLYLIVATAAGPLFCCCSVRQVALLTDLFRPSTRTIRPAEQTVPPCCRQHATTDSCASGEVVAVADSCACKGQHSPATCPAGSPSPVVTTPIRSAPLAPTDEPGLVLVVAALLAPHQVGSVAGECIVIPCREPRDLLYSLHILRC